MKKAMVTFMLAACVMWMPLAVADDVDSAEPFMGKWNLEMDFNGRIVNSKLTITKDEEGKLGGTWESRRGTSNLEDVKVKEGELTFARTMNRQGMEMTITSAAKIKEGKLIGAMQTQMGDMAFTGVRPKPEDEETQAEEGQGGGVAAMLQRMDTNGDGKIQESEAPERMQQFFGMIDSNGDGELDEAELEVMMQFRRQQQGN